MEGSREKMPENDPGSHSKSLIEISVEDSFGEGEDINNACAGFAALCPQKRRFDPETGMDISNGLKLGKFQPKVCAHDKSVAQIAIEARDAVSPNRNNSATVSSLCSLSGSHSECSSSKLKVLRNDLEKLCDDLTENDTSTFLSRHKDQPLEITCENSEVLVSFDGYKLHASEAKLDLREDFQAVLDDGNATPSCSEFPKGDINKMQTISMKPHNFRNNSVSTNSKFTINFHERRNQRQDNSSVSNNFICDSEAAFKGVEEKTQICDKNNEKSATSTFLLHNIVAEGSDFVAPSGSRSNNVAEESDFVASTGSRSNTVAEGSDFVSLSGSRNNNVAEGSVFVAVSGSRSNNVAEGRDFVAPSGSRSNNVAEGSGFVAPSGSRSNNVAEGRDFVAPSGPRSNNVAEGRDFVAPSGPRSNNVAEGRDFVAPSGPRNNNVAEGSVFVAASGPRSNNVAEGSDFVAPSGSRSNTVAKGRDFVAPYGSRSNNVAEGSVFVAASGPRSNNVAEGSDFVAPSGSRSNNVAEGRDFVAPSDSRSHIVFEEQDFTVASKTCHCERQAASSHRITCTCSLPEPGLIQHSTFHINDLPSSIILNVINFLPLYDILCRIPLVCKKWLQFSRDSSLWRHVDLSEQVKVDDMVLKRLTGLSDKVVYLDITDSKLVTNEGFLQVLEKCPNIHTLKIVRCAQLNSDGLLSIGRFCPHLHALWLDNCYGLSDDVLKMISEGCPLLRVLRMGQCGFVSNTGIEALSGGCRLLKTIMLDHCQMIGDEGVCALVKHCNDLEEISLRGCQLTDQSIGTLNRLKQLRKLDISNMPGVSMETFITVAKGCGLLNTLSLSLNPWVNDDCIEVVAKYGKHLEKLLLVSCNLSDNALLSLGQFCHKLNFLDVGWCQQITDLGVRKISELCPLLKCIGLIRCDAVTEQGVEKLVSEFPHIKYSTFKIESCLLLEQARLSWLVKHVI